MTRRIKSLVPTVRTADLRTVKGLGRGEAYADRKRLYDSKRWQETRAAKLRRDPLCQVCAALGVTMPAVIVDHWTPLAQQGAETADHNLVSMCSACHSRKTRCEQDETPFPAIVPSKPRRLSIG